jgi:hypothetical protein
LKAREYIAAVPYSEVQLTFLSSIAKDLIIVKMEEDSPDLMVYAKVMVPIRKALEP